jgi:hypothetical protein
MLRRIFLGARVVALSILAVGLAGAASLLTVDVFAPKALADFPAWPPAAASAAAPNLTSGQPSSLSVDLYNSLRVLLMTPGGVAIDPTQPQPVINYQSSSATTNQVSCASTTGGTLLLASNSNAKKRQLTNTSTTLTVYVGPPTVTTTTGMPLLPSQTLELLPGYTGEIDCIVASTSVTVGAAQLQ